MISLATPSILGQPPRGGLPTPSNIGSHQRFESNPFEKKAWIVLHQTPTFKAAKGGSGMVVGDLIKNRFEIVERITNRGTSILYKTIDRDKPDAEKRSRYVTVKVLQQKSRAQEQSLLDLQLTAKKTRRLKHPNIVNVHGFFRDGDMTYLIMEYLSGESLSQRFVSGELRELPHKELLRIISEMGKALAFAHSMGVIHCDFKPANVILSDSGEVKST